MLGANGVRVTEFTSVITAGACLEIIHISDVLITRTRSSFTNATKKFTVGYGRRICALIREDEDGRWFLKILTRIFAASEGLK